MKRLGQRGRLSSPSSDGGRTGEPRRERFWRGVEAELCDIDLCDFQDFLDAEDLPYEPDPEFKERLRGVLLRRFASRS